MGASTYSVIAKGVTVVGANTMIYLRPAATATLHIARCWISQGAAAAASEQNAVALFTQPKASPTLVAATPFQHGGSGDSASSLTGATTGAAGTAGINASAEGTGTIIYGPTDGFNNLNGWNWVATPDERIILAASSASGFGLMLVTVPTAKTLWYAGITWHEYG